MLILGLSLVNYGQAQTLSFVGLKHYSSVINDSLLYTTLEHNAILLVVNMFFHTAVALGVAMLIRKTYSRLQPIFQFSVLAPMAMMGVGVGLIWNFMYHPQSGIINWLLRTLGVDWQPIWLSSLQLALPAIILAINWWWFGFWVTIWLVGLGSIDDRLYAAAKIDGANRIQQFIYITLPQLRNSALLVVTLTVINAIKNFQLFWIMTQGGPGRSTEVIMTWIYKVAFNNFNISRAAAITMVMFLIIVVLSLITVKSFGLYGGASS